MLHIIVFPQLLGNICLLQRKTFLQHFMNKIVWDQIIGKQDCGSYVYTNHSISIPVQTELEILSNQ